MGDIVYFYGSPTQMMNEILQLGFGWFLYDFVHYMGRRPMHTGVVVEVNDRKYLLHACGSKVWFQGLEAHLRYRLYVGYDIQVQPVEWENDPKHLDNIQEFLRTHVDETYRHPLNVSMLPEVPEFDSERGRKMRTEPWLFPMGQHENYTMSYDYYKEVYGDKLENGGYTCAEIVVLFYDLVGMFDSSKGFAPVTYLPYNLLPGSETFHLINAKFTQTLRLEMRDSEYFWEPKPWGWWANRYYEDIIWLVGYEVPERGLYEEFTWFYGAWFNYW